MKRAWLVAVLVVGMSGVLAAQRFHGVPPSVSSPTPFNRAPGVPASVTSPTPCLLQLGCGASFNGGFGGRRFGGRPAPFVRHRRSPGLPLAYPAYYPYSYYPYSYSTMYETEPEPAPVEVRSETPGPTVFEHNGRIPARDGEEESGRYGTHYLDGRESERGRERGSAEAPAAAPLEIVPTVLVYRDGRKREIRNYAIVGETLYELGGLTSHKVPLAELDLDATQKENDDRGSEFTLPNPPKGD